MNRQLRMLIATALLIAGIGTTAQAQTFTILHSFPSTTGDGWNPYGELTRDAAGNLFGTTFQGGTSGFGTVFELVFDSDTNSYTEKVLYSFRGGTGDGSLPEAGLVRDSAGNLFGTTSLGGPSESGTVFELVFDSDTNSYAERVLYTFGATTGDGWRPRAGLVRNPETGGLFGTTIFGGSSTNCSSTGLAGCGTVFELSPPAATGGSWTETVLHSFTGGDGSLPEAGLVRSSVGNLFGTTSLGGSPGFGTVFELSPPPTTGGSWTETVLHIFTGGDGAAPYAGLVRDLAGNLFRTTVGGGSSTNCTGGCGTVFELQAASGPSAIPPAGVGVCGTTTCQQGQSVEPISTGNGNYFYQHADFVIPGRGMPLVLQRSQTPPAKRVA
jgi:uncharacterized repeat protein (TIGR03803 family)